MLNADDIETLGTAAGTSAQALFEAINDVAKRRLDAGLVSSLRHDEGAETVERIYSSNPQAYAVGGKKRKQDNDWSREVLAKHRVLVSAGDASVRQYYSDYEQIFGLGLHSCVNIPLVADGQCIGTLNVLRAQADWSADEVAVVRLLGLAALAAVLMIR